MNAGTPLKSEEKKAASAKDKKASVTDSFSLR
jgi:hypothetical protein